METIKDLDIFEMPFDVLAAYWLSIKKLLDAKKNRNALAEEIKHTDEPFIRNLLDVLSSDMDAALSRRLGEACRDRLLDDFGRKLDLMSMALVATAAKENPRVTLVSMNSLFPTPPLDEKTAFSMAQGLMQGTADRGADLKVLVGVDHKALFDRLVIKLLFYVVAGRNGSVQDLDRFMEHSNSRFFREGLSLVIDGFEPSFLRPHLNSIRDATVAEARLKMNMALEMCVGIHNNLSYKDVYRIARAYLPDWR